MPSPLALALVDGAPLVGVPRAFATRVLHELARGPDAVWTLGSEAAPRLVGAVIDTCASRDDVADLFAVAGHPGDLSTDEVDALLEGAERIAATGPRAHLEVAVPPDRLTWAPIAERRGYRRAYTLIHMRRDAGPIIEVPVPPDLRWEPVSERTVADHHRVVTLAFAEIPGAMVPPLDAFAAHALNATPRPELLLEGHRVVGYARVDRRGDEAEVAAIGRDPAARGRGLGDVLLTHALALALALALRPRSVTLTVAAENARASALYRRHGFVAYEEIPVYRRPV
jgi:ribosomal protein S18 acetylase RimI-like enzyme